MQVFIYVLDRIVTRSLTANDNKNQLFQKRNSASGLSPSPFFAACRFNSHQLQLFNIEKNNIYI